MKHREKNMVPASDRRRFISGAIAVALGLCAGGWWFSRRSQTAVPPLADDPVFLLVTDMLQRCLPFLELDTTGLVEFTRDLQARKQTPLLRQAERGDATAQDKLAEQFLLSSDFFAHGADESRTIYYVAYYDQYEKPCSNPFAQLA
jgi:hypothetical protein